MEVPAHMCSDCDTVADLVTAIYGDLHEDPEARSIEHLTKRGILTPKNDDVDCINQHALNCMPNSLPQRDYLSCDRV